MVSETHSPEDAPQLTWKERSVVVWPLLRTTASWLRIFSGRDTSGAPVPDLVLRVGVVGHINIDETDELKTQVREVLQSLKTSCQELLPQYQEAFPRCELKPQAECRVISQLAAGADQLVAQSALELGYHLECPLPVEREEFAADIARNPGNYPDSVGRYRTLLSKAETVLELDVLNQKSFVPTDVYKSAAWTLLSHSDILLSLVRSDARQEIAGTKWLIEEAIKRAVPVIEILVDKHSCCRLIHVGANPLQETRTSDPQWSRHLIEGLVLPPKNRYRNSGLIIERFRNSIRAHEIEWPRVERNGQNLAKTADRSTLASDDLWKYWEWAERRANAYRDLYQGAYLSLAFLALSAVAGALVGVYDGIDCKYVLSAKGMEVVAIVLMLITLGAATKGHWRQRWLNYRWLEQQIRNAAILNLVGRTVPAQSSPILAEVQKDGAWIAWYFRAVLRQAHLPSVKLDQQSLRNAAEIILQGQITRQLDYYRRQSHRAYLANHRLEIIAKTALWFTLVTTVFYIPSELFHVDQHIVHVLHVVALTAGLFGPALAAAIAAIRAQGEFVQLETRYRGVRDHLVLLQKELLAVLTSADAQTPLNGGILAKVSFKAASAMLDEVSHWRSLLHTNEPEL